MFKWSFLGLVALAGTFVCGAFAGCRTGHWFEAYGGERCYVSHGAIVMKCNDKSSGANCGMRLSSAYPAGAGRYTTRIKAAPGAGVTTTYYLSTSNDIAKNHPWNEIDFEIFGNLARPGSSMIWTNFFTGVNVEHPMMIRVPFDTSAGYHAYTIDIDGVHNIIRWLVDGHVYRAAQVGFYPDMMRTIHTRAFRPFYSLWGLGPGDNVNARGTFMNAMGRLNRNRHPFPVHAVFQSAWTPLPSAYSTKPAFATRTALPGGHPEPATVVQPTAGTPVVGQFRNSRMGKLLPILLAAFYIALFIIVIFCVCLCMARRRSPEYNEFQPSQAQASFISP